MTAAALEERTIRFEADCDGSVHCRPLAEDMAQTLRAGYGEVSLLEIPGTLEEWRAQRRTARKRVDRCRRRGYSFRPLARELHADEIHAINTSKSHRQGRPMTAGYLERPSFSPLPVYPCARHGIRTWGVWDPTGLLVAYAVVYRVGELALISQILGHGDHLAAEIMYLLGAGLLEHEIRVRPGAIVYNRHDSGQEGLVFYKERMGFREFGARWELS